VLFPNAEDAQSPFNGANIMSETGHLHGFDLRFAQQRCRYPRFGFNETCGMLKKGQYLGCAVLRG